MAVPLVILGQTFELLLLVVTAVRRLASIRFLRLATLCLAQAIDLATFSVMVTKHGSIAEANPIVRDLFDSFGMPAVIIAKLALVFLVSALFIAAWARGRSGVWSLIGGLPLALAITAGLIGGFSNAAAILG